MVFELPTALEFGGRSWDIETDYRQVLRILSAYEDPELSDAEKALICLYDLYVDFDDIPKALLQAAYDAAMAFIDHGSGGGQGPRMMDWTQDAALIFPAINRVAGYEVRGCEYLHWWTFLGFFMEIRDTTYATVLGLRARKSRGKKLEPWEREYWVQNRRICELRPRYTDAELEEQARLEAILGGGGRTMSAPDGGGDRLE